MSNIGLNFGGDSPGRHRGDPQEEHGDEHPDEHPDHPEEHHDAGHHDEPPRRRMPRSCLAAVVVLVILAAGAWFGGNWAVDQFEARFGDAPDYPGPGSGEVVFEVEEGASSAAIGRKLKEAGVVKSVQAFTDAARSEPKSRSIQVGFYSLKEEMKASDALDVLVDPANLVQASVTVPEGARVKDVVGSIVENTELTEAAVEKALTQPRKIGLPPEANDNPEGYLYPATYTVPPKMTAVQLIKQMVAKTKAVEQKLGVAEGAQRLGYSKEEILTVASLLEHEANRSEDYPRVARVLYNRLEQGMPLQLDSTVRYLSGRSGEVWTTAQEREHASEYNTYKHKGLPPGPIGSPGEETIEAALNPAQGDWLYFVTVNLETGETAFAASYDEHLDNVQQLRKWCSESDSDAC